MPHVLRHLRRDLHGPFTVLGADIALGDPHLLFTSPGAVWVSPSRSWPGVGGRGNTSANASELCRQNTITSSTLDQVPARPDAPCPGSTVPMVRLLVGALSVAAAAACSLSTADVMIVLGAQLVSNSSGAIVPGLSGDCRSSGAAMLYNYLDGKTPVVTSGGYLIGESAPRKPPQSRNLVDHIRAIPLGPARASRPCCQPLLYELRLHVSLAGVRYEIVNNSILVPPNSTFASYATARNYASEAFVLKQNMVQGVGPGVSVPPSAVIVEEDAASTAENALAAGAMLGQRLAQYTFHKPSLCQAVVTSLYHMPRAMDDFAQADSTNSQVAAYAEDWVALIPPTPQRDWIPILRSYYSSPIGGHQYNTTLLGEILEARRSGDLSRSVAELVPSAQLDTSLGTPTLETRLL